MNDRKKLLVSLTTVIQVLEDIGCAGVFNEIELKDGTKEKIDCVEEIIKYIDNDLSIDPYEFENLKIGMWIWDNSYKVFLKIIEIREYGNTRKLKVGDSHCQLYIEFEENRFYPISKVME